MNKIMIAVCGIALVAMASIPAHASPTNKKVTVSCAFVDGNTGYADVMLYDSGSGSFPCPEVTCDASVTSVTVACDAPLRVNSIFADCGLMNVQSTSNPVELKGGKGISLSFTSDGGDTVAVTVKYNRFLATDRLFIREAGCMSAAGFLRMVRNQIQRFSASRKMPWAS